MTKNHNNNLIGEDFSNRLAKRIAKDANVDMDLAKVIVKGTIHFLKMCADHPRVRFVPSPLIDIGWHAFLIFTKEYQDFCSRVAGRFLHHEPKEGSKVKIIKTHHDTVIFMKKNNISFDRKLWKACEVHPEVKEQKKKEEEFSCCTPNCGGPCCCGGQ